MSARRSRTTRPGRARISLRRGADAEPVSDDSKRQCQHCGDFIDPKDWCAGCKAAKGPCRAPHRRDRKRADAVFCNAACRSAYRSSYIRDCL